MLFDPIQQCSPLFQLITLWRERGWQVATCESYTGGYIASQFTQEPGSSKWFRGAIVCYQTSVKEQLVGIPRELIERYGVVSSEVATAMAEQAGRIFSADLVISTTGVAGPTGGTPQYPVGSVCIAISLPQGMHNYALHLAGSRSEVIKGSYYFILNQLSALLLS